MTNCLNIYQYIFMIILLFIFPNHFLNENLELCFKGNMTDGSFE